MYIPNRRALPTLFVSNDEFAVLDEMATSREMTVSELLKELITPLAQGSKVVVLQVSEHTWSSFSAFFEDESVEESMSRCLEADADDFARALIQAGAT
jgi:hypothetical protein